MAFNVTGRTGNFTGQYHVYPYNVFVGKFMNMSKLISFVPSAYYVIIKAPGSYKLIFILTIFSIGYLVVHGCTMYKESLKYHDFFIPNIRIFVDEQDKERTLAFDVESLSEMPISLTQIQVAIYDTKEKENALHKVTQSGRVNPLKKKDTIPFSFGLDLPPHMGFNFTKKIKEDEFAWQSYKIIVVVHYNHNSLSSSKEQRFEFLYKVVLNEDGIYGTIREYPNQLLDAKQIYKDVPYETKP